MGPGRVRLLTHHVVQMQLGYQVTQGSNIHLARLKEVRQGFRQETGFMHELLAIIQRQMVDLRHPGAARHQNEPGVVGIVHQQQPTQGKITHRQGIGCQPRIQFKFKLQFVHNAPLYTRLGIDQADPGKRLRVAIPGAPPQPQAV